jgi:hypothetical protein
MIGDLSRGKEEIWSERQWKNALLLALFEMELLK